MKDNRVDHAVSYLQHMTKPNGNHGEKDKHEQEQRAWKQLRSKGWVVKGLGGGFWVRGFGPLAFIQSSFCAAGVK